MEGRETDKSSAVYLLFQKVFVMYVMPFMLPCLVWFFLLSIGTIKLRYALRFAIGDGGYVELTAMVPRGLKITPIL